MAKLVVNSSTLNWFSHFINPWMRLGYISYKWVIWCFGVSREVWGKCQCFGSPGVWDSLDMDMFMQTSHGDNMSGTWNMYLVLWWVICQPIMVSKTNFLMHTHKTLCHGRWISVWRFILSKPQTDGGGKSKMTNYPKWWQHTKRSLQSPCRTYGFIVIFSKPSG